ncbi:MAG: PAS domain S-box protein [Syntrophorhabdaceae bacterium]|nr:PAS domain S-box protein [Syntrophorhabdaceae bacterium]MDD5243628.1 PAS domain S-box protein [Syntrophorhabdaceae bacterium]
MAMRTSAKKQVQKNPNQNGEALRALVNATRETLLLIDTNGTILLVNETAAERFGKNVQELVGTCLYDHFPPELAKSRKEHLDKVFTTGKPVHFEDTRAGRSYETYCYPIFNEEGKVSRGTIFSHDFTHHKQAEKALKESEERVRNYIERAPDGVFIVDDTGRYLEANKAACQFTGYSKEEIEKMSIRDLLAEESLEDGLAHFKKLIATGAATSDLWHKHKNGSKCCLTVNAVKLSETRVLGFCKDITTRKLAEEELKQAVEKLRKGLVGTIQVMSLIIETRDPYTAGHQKKVSHLARAIAQEMNLSKDMIDKIRMAGVIHDLGKISVPAEILSKPTKLTAIEFSLIKVHSQAGYNILKDAELPYPIAEIVLQHHERLDGSGYPQSLKNGQILLESQIIAVADVIEAMASHRPYRPARGIDVALEEIEKNKGIFYDTKAVDACTRLFREKGFAFEATAS